MTFYDIIKLIVVADVNLVVADKISCDILVNSKNQLNSYMATDASATGNTVGNQLFKLDNVSNRFGKIDTSFYSFLQIKNYGISSPTKHDSVRVHLPINWTFGEYLGFYMRVFAYDIENQRTYDLSNFYFGFKNFTGNSPMNAAYGIGVQGHWPGNSNPISTSTNLFYGLASNNIDFYTRLFAIPDGEISTKGTPMAFSLGQNAELALINGYTKLSLGVGGSINIYSTEEPDTYNYSYGYLFVDKLFLVSPGIDLSANLYIDGAVTLGFTYSKCAKTSLSNDDSDTPNYLYSEEVDLSNWALRIGFMFN